MSVSVVPTLLSSMRDALRAALPDCEVTTALVEPTAPEHLMLLDVPEGSQSWATLGNRSREERGRLHGRIFVVRPGAGEEVITETRERAYALLGVLEDLLVTDPTWVGTVRVSSLDSHDLAQAPRPNGRVCEIDFELTYQARLAR